MKAGELQANARNWRQHPTAQAEALRGVLLEVGQVGELYAYTSERAGGKLVLIDGHLRQELDPAQDWDVAITDLTDAEADKVLLARDPIAAMATVDAGRLDTLLREVQTGSEGLASMLAGLAKDAGITPPDFQPVGVEQQGRLDEKAKVKCPHCGQEFVP